MFNVVQVWPLLDYMPFYIVIIIDNAVAGLALISINRFSDHLKPAIITHYPIILRTFETSRHNSKRFDERRLNSKYDVLVPI